MQQNIDEKLLVVMGRCFQSLEKALFEHIRSTDFTPTQFAVLEMLYHKGPLTVNGIIEKSFSSSGNIGVVITNLIKVGFVEKQINEQDRRSRRITLTASGRARISMYYPKHRKALECYLAELTEAEKEILILLLKKLGKSITE